MPPHLHRANTEILILKKTKNYFYLVAMMFLLEKPFIHRTMSAESYTPQIVFLIFVHGLRRDSISILVTHHTTCRRVRHRSDYLVDNPSFLLEMFQGWSNSNHNEKKNKVKQTVQYYGNWLHLVQKTLRVLLCLPIFLFFYLAHIFFPSPCPHNLPAGTLVQSKIAKLTAQYCTQRRSKL